MQQNRFKTLSLVTSCLVALSLVIGCAQPSAQNRTSNGEKKNYAARGAVTGAIGGAALGMMTASKKDRKKGAILGAIVGGAAGAAYGSYLDKQEEELRAAMEGTGVDVDRQGDVLKITMPGGVTFATGSADIASNFYAPLRNVANSLSQYDQSTIEIIGHTDNTGSRSLNMDLSKKRAQSVANFFTSSGVSGTRIMFSGAGPDFPIASNASEQGKAKNRRVEITLYPPQ